MGRSDLSDHGYEPWHDVAWRLWRHQWLTFVQISGFLALEGWCVSPGQVADVVMARASSELGR